MNELIGSLISVYFLIANFENLMKVFHNLNELTPFKRAVVTIGSFDGVHSGHQNILNKVRNLAMDCGGESVLVTFYPHPRHFLFPEQDDLPHFRISVFIPTCVFTYEILWEGN